MKVSYSITRNYTTEQRERREALIKLIELEQAALRDKLAPILHELAQIDEAAPTSIVVDPESYDLR